MSGLSLISGSMSFARSIGVDVPFADRLLAGNVCGGTVRDTKRSVQPRRLMPSSIRNAPAVADAWLACSAGNGLRLPVVLPLDYTLVAVLKNHIRPVGGLNPVIADFGPGATGAQTSFGNGLAMQGAGGNISAVSFYQLAGSTNQGAFVSVAAQDSGRPALLAATMDGMTSRAHAGVAGELVTSQITVSTRNPENWPAKPLYAGCDARVVGDSGVDAAYAPQILLALVYSPLTTAEVTDIYRWAAEFAPMVTGLAIN